MDLTIRHCFELTAGHTRITHYHNTGFRSKVPQIMPVKRRFERTHIYRLRLASKRVRLWFGAGCLLAVCWLQRNPRSIGDPFQQLNRYNRHAALSIANRLSGRAYAGCNLPNAGCVNDLDLMPRYALIRSPMCCRSAADN